MRPSTYGNKIQLLVLSSTNTTLKIKKLKKQENEQILSLGIDEISARPNSNHHLETLSASTDYK